LSYFNEYDHVDEHLICFPVQHKHAYQTVEKTSRTKKWQQLSTYVKSCKL